MEATIKASEQLDGLLARLSEYHLEANDRELQVGRVLLTSEYKDLLQNAGYKRADSLPVRKDGFPDSGVGIYTRSREKTIDALVEADLMQKRPGISYVSLPNQKSYNAFREDLQNCLVRSDKIQRRCIFYGSLMLGVVGGGVAFAAAVYGKASSPPPELVKMSSELAKMLILPVGVGVVVSGFATALGGVHLTEKSSKRSQERILSLHPETNPAIALEKALRHRNH